MDKQIYIYFTEHDIYFSEQMFILLNINLELKSGLRTKYSVYRTLLHEFIKVTYVLYVAMLHHDYFHHNGPSSISLWFVFFLFLPDPYKHLLHKHLFPDSEKHL